MEGYSEKEKNQILRKVQVLGAKCEQIKMHMKKEKKKRESKNFGLAFINLSSTKIVNKLVSRFDEIKQEIKFHNPSLHKMMTV